MKSNFAAKFACVLFETCECELSQESSRGKTKNQTPTKMNTPTKTRKNHFAKCCFCGEQVNLSEEGATYRNGNSAHEDCHDANEFGRENVADLRD